MTAPLKSRRFPVRLAQGRRSPFTAQMRTLTQSAPASARWGARVGKIVDMLYSEKIDIVKYSDDPAQFIAASLAPADVISVTVDETAEKACRVIVPDLQLSLAIGNKGQNARLAAKLTGWKIDIKPESGKTEPSVEL